MLCCDRQTVALSAKISISRSFSIDFAFCSASQQVPPCRRARPKATFQEITQSSHLNQYLNWLAGQAVTLAEVWILVVFVSVSGLFNGNSIIYIYIYICLSHIYMCMNYPMHSITFRYVAFHAIAYRTIPYMHQYV